MKRSTSVKNFHKRKTKKRTKSLYKGRNNTKSTKTLLDIKKKRLINHYNRSFVTPTATFDL